MDKQRADKAYEEGNPILTDSEYDKEFGINATSEYVDENSPWEKTEHLSKYSGLSMNKLPIYIDGEYVYERVYRINLCGFETDYVVSPKYDGVSISLTYDSGILVSAVTKGADGIGEDVLRNIKKIPSVPLSFRHYDEYNSFDFELTSWLNQSIVVVRAEVMFEKETFWNNKNIEYTNPRNGAAGALKAFDGVNAHLLSVYAYGLDILGSDDWETSQQFECLENLDFKCHYLICDEIRDVIEAYSHFLSVREDFPVEMDGIVVAFNNEKLFGVKNGAPTHMTALKFPYESKESKIVDIIWQKGRKGHFTPVAEIEPVEISGSMISRVTLKNLDEMTRLGVVIGSKVAVSKRGDVIPNIENNLSKYSEPVFLQICPFCNMKLVRKGPFISCKNSSCGSKEFNDLIFWFEIVSNHFGLKGISEKRIKQLYDFGFAVEPCDLYSLDYSDLLSLEGVEDSTANKILRFAEYNQIPLDIFVLGLNLSGVGPEIAKFLAREYNSLELLLEATPRCLMTIEGLGHTMSHRIVNELDESFDKIRSLLDKVEVVPMKEEKVGNLLEGLRFCITGKLSMSRAKFSQLIQENGGAVSGVSGNTDYVLLGDSPGTNKTMAAVECHVKMINEEEFFSLLNK